MVLHGIGYHSAPYKIVADALNSSGTEVYGLDARGHGLSQGRRGYIGTSIEVGAGCRMHDPDLVEGAAAERPRFSSWATAWAQLALNYAKTRCPNLLVSFCSLGFDS